MSTAPRRWMADRAVEGGGLLDLSVTVSVRTPGHRASGHLPGWHLWYRADPAHPVHLGPLRGCHGLAGEDGPQAVAATIRSGFHRAGTTA
jgi:hypothetical protein